MTRYNDPTKITFAANGATTRFAIPFPFTDNAQVYVIHIDASDLQTPLVENTHYTIDNNTNDIVTTATYTIGEDVFIYRATDRTQELDLKNYTDYRPENHEGALDKLTDIMNELEEKVDRSIKFDITSQANQPTLPYPEDGKAMVWDDNGNLVNSEYLFDDAVNQSLAAQTAAEAARDAALSAQSISENARDTANTHKENAATSAAQAIQSAALAGHTVKTVLTNGVGFNTGDTTITATGITSNDTYVYTVYYDGLIQHNEPVSAIINGVNSDLTLSGGVPAGVSEILILGNFNRTATDIEDAELNALNAANAAVISETNAAASENAAAISANNAATSEANAQADAAAIAQQLNNLTAGSFFELDENLDVMPTLSPLVDKYYEQDENGDIQPIAA